MKVFVNEVCYVNMHDLLNKPIPLFIKLDKDFYEGSEIIKITGEQAIEYMKNRSDIIDYDDVKDLTSEELELKIKESYKKLENYANRWYNAKYYRRKGNEIDKKFLDDYKLAEVIYNELLNYQKNKNEIDNIGDKLVHQDMNCKVKIMKK